MPKQPRTMLAVVSTAMCLGVLLTIIRAHIIGFSLQSLQAPLTQVPLMLIGAYHDLLLVAALTGVFMVLLYTVRRYAAVQRVLGMCYFPVSLLTLALALVNIKTVEFLGRPFNYQWLYYSDFLRSMEVRQAIVSVLSWKFLVASVVLGTGMIVGAHFLKRGLAHVLDRYLLGRALLAGFVLLGVFYFPFARWYLEKNQWSVFKLENPAVSFLSSVGLHECRWHGLQHIEENIADLWF